MKIKRMLLTATCFIVILLPSTAAPGNSGQSLQSQEKVSADAATELSRSPKAISVWPSNSMSS
jgi:hypothetical protein